MHEDKKRKPKKQDKLGSASLGAQKAEKQLHGADGGVKKRRKHTQQAHSAAGAPQSRGRQERGGEERGAQLAVGREEPPAGRPPKQRHGQAQKNKQKRRQQQQQQQQIQQQQRQQRQGERQGQRQAQNGQRPPHAPPLSLNPKKGGKGSSLLERMRARLSGGRFRWLNEQLYTSGSGAAAALVAEQPELLAQYHEGFREQTRGWPVQPVEVAIRWLRTKPASWAVADLGCGDAQLAAGVEQCVHSFDLAATAPGVVACNIADVPLRDAAVDAAVFCLSLMGTDYGAFLAEAARITRPGGWLWVAEVASRFVDERGRSLLPAFTAAVGRLGYELRREDTRNTHFLILEFQKSAEGGEAGEQPDVHAGSSGGPAWPALRPCQYKKR